MKSEDALVSRDTQCRRREVQYIHAPSPIIPMVVASDIATVTIVRARHSREG
jgi:hypothetical protein